MRHLWVLFDCFEYILFFFLSSSFNAVTYAIQRASANLFSADSSSMSEDWLETTSASLSSSSLWNSLVAGVMSRREQKSASFGSRSVGGSVWAAAANVKSFF
jgi:hypothetical protein